MKRVYIVYEELEDSNYPTPIDVVSSLDRAETLCYQLESEHLGFIYWWREVISSED